jgi:integrase/recombinase XerC
MQLCRRDIWRAVKLARDSAGITRRVYPHLLRHTAATALIRGGANVASVQAFLGHSSLQTTTRYVHLAAEDVKREYLKAHPRARVQLVAPAARRLTAAPRPSR